jgi:hypothetical protein
MNRQTAETCLVRCGVRRPAQRLSILDVMPGTVPVPCAAAFAYRIERDRLLTSLRACLQEFPLLAGRLIESPPPYWSIDGNDAGLRYTVIELDREMPAYGYAQPMKPALRQLTEPLAFSPLNRDQPLVGIRVTRFRDGTVIGFTNTHALMDGIGAWNFLDRWSQHFRGQTESIELTFDRAPLLFANRGDLAGVAAPDDPVPAQPVSRLRVAGFIARAILAPLTGAATVFHLPGSRLAAHKERLSARLPAGEWISTQDVTMSLLIQAVAAATEQERLQIGSIYDLRNLPELGLSRQYVANASISRMFTNPTAELVRDPLTAARNLRRLATSVSAEHVRAELWRMQDQITPRTAMRYLPGFIRDQFRDGLLLNNYSRFPIYRADFGGGPPLWGDYPQPPLHRVINLCPDPSGDGVAVHLTLPRAELRRFMPPR